MECRIIGCGTDHRGDDAAGLVVVRRLSEIGVEAYEHSGDGVALMERWQGADAVVLIDAVVGHGPLGSLAIWDGSKVPMSDNVFRSSTHGVGIAEAVKLARALDRMPSRLWICGVEGHQFELGTGLSPEVAKTVERLALRLSSACSAIASHKSLRNPFRDNFVSQFKCRYCQWRLLLHF